jgi:hypothetical protein
MDTGQISALPASDLSDFGESIARCFRPYLHCLFHAAMAQGFASPLVGEEAIS